MNDAARQGLNSILAQYGRTIYNDVPRCEALLLDRCATYKKERSALIAALREGIPTELNGWQNSQPYPSLVARLSHRLQDNLGLDAAVAQWAVESWAIALGVLPQPFTPPTSIDPATSSPTVLENYRREDVFQPPKPDFITPQPAMPPIERSYYAGFWQRFGATVIDGLILLIPFLIVAMIAFGVSSSDTTMTRAQRIASARQTTQLLSLIVGWLYFATLESSASQATFGKRALGLKVVDRNGNRISFGRASGRYFGKLLSSMIFYIGFIMAAFTEHKQALHDLIASTFVVKSQS